MFEYSPQQQYAIQTVANGVDFFPNYQAKIEVVLPIHADVGEISSLAQRFFYEAILRDEYYRSLLDEFGMALGGNAFVAKLVPVDVQCSDLNRGELLKLVFKEAETSLVLECTVSSVLADVHTLVQWLMHWLAGKDYPTDETRAINIAEYLCSERFDENTFSYWNNVLCQYPKSHIQGTRGSNPSLGDYCVEPIGCSHKLTQQLKQYCESMCVELESVICFAWYKTIATIRKNKTLNIGVYASGRDVDELGNIQFPLSRVVPLKGNDHADIYHSIVKLEQELKQSKMFAGGYTPDEQRLNPISYVFQYFALSDLEINVVDAEEYNASSTIKLCCLDSTSGLAIKFIYDLEAFSDTEVNKLGEILNSILEAICAGDATESIDIDNIIRSSAITLLHEQKVSSVFSCQDLVSLYYQAWNNVAPEQRNLLAVRTESCGIARLELEQYSNQLAREIARSAPKANDIVGVICTSNVDSVITILAILKIGCAILPIDPSIPLIKLNSILKNGGCRFVIVGPEYEEQYRGLDANSIIFSHKSVDLETCQSKPLECVISPSAIAYVSLATDNFANQNFVAISHGSIANYVQALKLQCDMPLTGDYLSLNPLSADSSFTSVFTALSYGCCIRLFDRNERRNKALLARSLKLAPCSVIKSNPSDFARLICDYPEIAPTELLILDNEFHADYPVLTEKRSYRTFCHYGMTETAVGVLVHQLCSKSNTGEAVIGKPLVNNLAFVLDKHLSQVGFGEIGHIYITGANLAERYIGNPELTDLAFVRAPWTLDKQLMFKTGDKGYLNLKGEIILCSQGSEVVWVEGYRIMLAEVNDAIKRTSLVQDVVTRYIEEQGICAFYVAENDSEDKLLEAIKPHLSSYMIPDNWYRVNKIHRKAKSELGKAGIALDVDNNEIIVTGASNEKMEPLRYQVFSNKHESKIVPPGWYPSG